MELRAGIAGSADKEMSEWPGRSESLHPEGKTAWGGGGGEAREEEKLGCGSMVCFSQCVIRCHARRESCPLLLPTHTCSPGLDGPAAPRGPRPVWGEEENEHGCKLGAKTWLRERRKGQLEKKAESVSGRMETEAQADVFWHRGRLPPPCSSSMWAPMMLLGQPGEYQK